DEPLLLVGVEVEDSDDVAVVELGDGLRLALEALAELLVPAEGGGDGLDGHEPVEDRVVGLVDLAHCSLADLVDDPVLAQLRALHGTRHPEDQQRIIARPDGVSERPSLCRERCSGSRGSVGQRAPRAERSNRWRARRKSRAAVAYLRERRLASASWAR